MSNDNITVWNKLWRSVGVDGIVDLGDGIIHENEPTQAIFFSKNALEHVDMLENPIVEFNKKFTPKFMKNHINDKDDQIRLKIAKLIDISYLPQMINDQNDSVRLEVASRIDISYLPQMINDQSKFVRRLVVSYIDPSYLSQMSNDKSFDVREIISKRLKQKI